MFSLGNSLKKYPPGGLAMVRCRKFVCREISWNEHVGTLAFLFPRLSPEALQDAHAATRTSQIEYRVSDADMQVS